MIVAMSPLVFLVKNVGWPVVTCSSVPHFKGERWHPVQVIQFNTQEQIAMGSSNMTEDQGRQIIKLLEEMLSKLVSIQGDVSSIRSDTDHLFSIKGDIRSTDHRIDQIYYLVHSISQNAG
jgi:hypothetical protein